MPWNLPKLSTLETLWTALIGSYPCRGFQLCTPLVQKLRGHLGPYFCRNCPILTQLFTRHKLERARAEDSSLPYSSRFLAHLFSTERCVHTAVCALLISLRHRTIWALLPPASAEPTQSCNRTLRNPNLIMSSYFRNHHICSQNGAHPLTHLLGTQRRRHLDLARTSAKTYIGSKRPAHKTAHASLPIYSAQKDASTLARASAE